MSLQHGKNNQRRIKKSEPNALITRAKLARGWNDALVGVGLISLVGFILELRMKYKRLSLKVYPAFDLTMTDFREFFFDSASDLLIAKNSIADILLYLQDDLNVMKDYSNFFSISVLPMHENSEWKEIEESELET